MANNDKDFAKLLKMMQRQGEANNPTGIEIGVMTGAKTCTVGELELDEEDLLIAEHLITGYYVAINPKNPYKSGDVPDSEYIPPLKAGDVVAVQQVDDETYAILERMVGS